MPYIDEAKRKSLRVGRSAPGTAGELNYLITCRISEYVGKYRNGLSYQTLNDVVGALESAKAEFQRRVVAPYEDKKIRENGDVYPPELVGIPTGEFAW
jgi:hypothetical protein